MRSRIIFQNPGCPVSVLAPADCGLSIEQIGRKDVPQGIPFWVVDSSVIPTDRAARAAWELDFSSIGQPSGVGERA